jgi:hypothetical protein
MIYLIKIKTKNPQKNFFVFSTAPLVYDAAQQASSAEESFHLRRILLL